MTQLCLDSQVWLHREHRDQGLRSQGSRPPSCHLTIWAWTSLSEALCHLSTSVNCDPGKQYLRYLFYLNCLSYSFHSVCLIIRANPCHMPDAVLNTSYEWTPLIFKTALRGWYCYHHHHHHRSFFIRWGNLGKGGLSNMARCHSRDVERRIPTQLNWLWNLDHEPLCSTASQSCEFQLTLSLFQTWPEVVSQPQWHAGKTAKWVMPTSPILQLLKVGLWGHCCIILLLPNHARMAEALPLPPRATKTRQWLWASPPSWPHLLKKK